MKFDVTLLVVLLLTLCSTFVIAQECDINSDGKTGLEEAIYALQVVAGINVNECNENLDCQKGYYYSKPISSVDFKKYISEFK